MTAPSWHSTLALRRLRPALVVAAIVFAGVTGAGLAAAALAEGRGYEATAFVALQPRSPYAVSPDAFRVITSRYPVVATAPGALAKVSRVTGIPADEIAKDVDVAVDPDTIIVRVSASNADAKTSARVANAVADELVRATAADPLLAGDFFAPAVAPTKPSGPAALPVLAAVPTVAVALALISFDLMAVSALRRAAPAHAAGWPPAAWIPRPPRSEPGSRTDA